MFTALLAIPSQANRVWLYMRSTAALFGAARTPGQNEKLQQLKEGVLLLKIWVEYLGWKYTQLGDRFEIGRCVVALFAIVLQNPF